MTTLRIKEISKREYNSVKKKDKKSILSGVLYRIHSLTEKDDKYTLTNAWFESRYGNFRVI